MGSGLRAALVFALLAAGSLLFYLRHRAAVDHAPAFAERQRVEEVESGAIESSTALRAFVPPPATLATDREFGDLVLHIRWHDGALAAGAMVEILPTDVPQPWQEVRWRRTDEQGEIVIERLPAGRASVRVLCGERFVLSSGGGADIDPEPHAVDVLGGVASEAEIRVARGVDLRLRVLDGRGLPIPLARLYAGAGRAPSRIPSIEVGRTDEQGFARLHSLHEGYVIVATTEDGRASAPETVGALLGQSGTAAASLSIGPQCASIRGRVLSADSTPLAHARIRVQVDPPRAEARGLFDAATTSDSDGAWSLTGMSAGSATIFVDAPRLAGWRTHMELEEGREQAVTCRLDGGYTLQGRIASSSGETIELAEVVALRIAGYSLGHGNSFGWKHYYRLNVDAAANGDYCLRWIPAGEASFRASADVGGVWSSTDHEAFAKSGVVGEWSPVL